MGTHRNLSLGYKQEIKTQMGCQQDGDGKDLRLAIIKFRAVVPTLCTCRQVP